MKPYLSALISFTLPSKLAIPLLNLLGHKIHASARIGWSWLQCHSIEMGAATRIGHFNLIRIHELSMEEQASIRTFNRMKGPLKLIMGKEAAIGSQNSIYRAPYPITIGESVLKMGVLTIITSKHQFDCTRSIEIGDYTTISGFDSQFWTHGYYHADEGRERIRIDGSIIIENNVSIGSRCLFNPGVKIGACINVGGNSCVSKSLELPGMYVAQPLRYLNRSMKGIQAKLTKNAAFQVENVYEKTI
jgi:acetyltransferase-like isoleucine patch superfamily enzyme